MADRYVENTDFVPNPTDQYGVLDTSDTAGAAHGRIEEIAPIFEVAKADAAITAAKALDPKDPTPESLVVLPQGQLTQAVDVEAHKEKVRAAAKDAEKNREQALEGRGPAQREAAEKGSKASAKAKAEQEQQGAGAR